MLAEVFLCACLWMVHMYVVHVYGDQRTLLLISPVLTTSFLEIALFALCLDLARLSSEQVPASCLRPSLQCTSRLPHPCSNSALHVCKANIHWLIYRSSPTHFPILLVLDHFWVTLLGTMDSFLVLFGLSVPLIPISIYSHLYECACVGVCGSEDSLQA